MMFTSSLCPPNKPLLSNSRPLEWARQWVLSGIGTALIFLTLAAAPMALAQTIATAAPAAPQVKFSTSKGDFVVELYPDKAPKTVANFLQYVKDKHYDGTIFHRVISNFMVQGGGYTPAYAEKAKREPVVHEGREALAKGGDKNVVGTLAMARTNDPNSASAQFFINVQNNDFLNPTVIPPGDPVAKFEFGGQTYTNVPRAQLVNAPQLFGYTVFGKVVSGMDVIQAIQSVPTGAGGSFSTDVPQTPIVIKSAVPVIISEPSSVAISTTETNFAKPATPFDVAKKKCEDLGFKPATERYGKCVLQLSK